jgi:hypothetical protein
MDPHRFDTLTRSLTETRSRRGALAVVLGSSLGLLGLADAAAKNKKKKGKDKDKDKGKKNTNGGTPTGQPPPPSAPSCAETCASNCATCAFRAAGPTLCGDYYETSGCATAKVCSSDNDCTETPAYPYCIASGEDRATGKLYPPCSDGKPRCSVIKEC